MCADSSTNKKYLKKKQGVMCQLSGVNCQIACFMFHVSHIMCQVSHDTCHMSLAPTAAAMDPPPLKLQLLHYAPVGGRSVKATYL